MKKVKKDDALRSAANKAGTKVRALFDNAGGEAHEVVETLEKQIKDKPVQASLIAAGAGLLLGLLLRRK